MNENSEINNTINTGNNDDFDIFYFSQSEYIPYKIKEDFKTKQNFLVILFLMKGVFINSSVNNLSFIFCLIFFNFR